MSDPQDTVTKDAPAPDAPDAPAPAKRQAKRRRRSAADVAAQSACPVCREHLGKPDPSFSEWARGWHDKARDLSAKLQEMSRELEASRALDEIAGSKAVRHARGRAIERLAAMLPDAEKQALEGKTALLRLILRAMR